MRRISEEKNKETNKFIKILFIFGLLLAIAYHLLIDYQKMTTLEIIFEFATTFITFGICAMLYYIFSIQVVDIFIENEGINFKKANGKYILFKEGSIVIIDLL